MAATPGYAATPKIGTASIGTAETSRTAPTNVGTVWAAGASGGRIDSVTITAASTTQAGAVRLFIYTGSVYRLLKEVVVQPVTASATTQVWSATVTFDGGIPMQTGYDLRATTEKSDTFHVIAFGADL